MREASGEVCQAGNDRNAFPINGRGGIVSAMSSGALRLTRAARGVVALAGLLLAVWAGGCGPTVAALDARETGDARMRQARERFERGDIRGAAEGYEAVLATAPGLARAHLDLALLQQDYLADPVGAVYHYRTYLKLRPDTDKRELLDARITSALKALGAATGGGDGAARRANELAARNTELEQRVVALEAEVARLRGPRETTKAPEARTYRVQRGDSLAAIAEAVYGRADDWRRIYDANRTVLPNRNVVPVGTLLVIP